jgi:hypothetical protein
MRIVLAGAAASAALFVSAAVSVENCTPLAFSCYGTSRTEAPIGQATALAELKKYGAKQATRVG